MQKRGRVKVDQFHLPAATILRIMKQTLPEHAKISKESKEAIQVCVSEFVSFITSESSDKCRLDKRKTINGEDILWAMETLGFAEYIQPLKLYLKKYRSVRRLFHSFLSYFCDRL